MTNLAVPNTPFVIADCRHGTFCFHPQDMIGRMLVAYGEWAQQEVAFLTRLLRPGDVALDIGAHIGTLTVPLARAVGPNGVVFAFEAQRLVYHNLCTNLHLNGLANVHVQNAIVTDTGGCVHLREIPYDGWRNSGGFTIPPEAASPPSGLYTPKLVLDQHLAHLPRCRLVKMDVEGHEAAALRGMARLIDRCRPILYLEANTAERFARIAEMLNGFDYRTFWHCEPHFNLQNYRGASSNLYGAATDINLVAFPTDWADGIPELVPAEDFAQVQQFAPPEI